MSCIYLCVYFAVSIADIWNI